MMGNKKKNKNKKDEERIINSRKIMPKGKEWRRDRKKKRYC